MIYSNTSEQTLKNEILENSNLKEKDFRVVKLENEDEKEGIAVFQIILPKRSINLNELFEIGIGGLNPSFLKADHGLLITFHVNK